MALATSFTTRASLLLTLCSLARGHGYMSNPRTRSFIAYQNNKYTSFSVPHSGNGNGLSQGPGNPNACGDPFQDTKSNFLAGPWKGQATYKKGQIITTALSVVTNHGGMFRMYLCGSKSPASLTLACFFNTPLISTATGTPRYWIQTSQVQFNTTLQWRLPASFQCVDGCVLMFEFTAMQSCIVPCNCQECGGYCKNQNPASAPGNNFRPFCGPAHPQSKLEFFRNCADVVIA